MHRVTAGYCGHNVSYFTEVCIAENIYCTFLHCLLIDMSDPCANFSFPIFTCSLIYSNASITNETWYDNNFYGPLQIHFISWSHSLVEWYGGKQTTNTNKILINFWLRSVTRLTITSLRTWAHRQDSCIHQLKGWWTVLHTQNHAETTGYVVSENLWFVHNALHLPPSLY